MPLRHARHHRRLLTWITAAGPGTLGTDDANWSGFTHRLVVASANISIYGQRLLRVTCLASSAQALTISKMYVQTVGAGDAYDFSTTPKEILFGGNSGFAIAAAARLVSDWTTITIPSGTNMVFSWYISGDASHDDTQRGASTGFSLYYKGATDDAITIDATGYTLQYSNTAFLISLIETAGNLADVGISNPRMN